MKLCGGKSLTGDMIAGVLEAMRLEDQDYRETMCGGLGAMQRMSSGVQTHAALKEHLKVGVRVGSDLFAGIIRMWKDMQEEFTRTGLIDSYPAQMTKDEWLKIRDNPLHPWYAYSGFGFGFKGVFFRTFYITPKMDPRRTCIKKISRCIGVSFSCVDYRDLAPVHELIYADPVYKNRAGGLDHSEANFNHDEFWEIAEHWTLSERENIAIREIWDLQKRAFMLGHSNIVAVTEYVAPEFWIPIASWQALKNAGAKTKGGGSHTPKPPKHEHLFVHKSQYDELCARVLARLKPGTRSHAAVLLAAELVANETTGQAYKCS